MKTIVLSVLCLFIFQLTLKSQDLVLLKNGESLNCKITSIDSAKIYFDIVKNNEKISTYIGRDEVVSYSYNYDFPEKKKRELRTSRDDNFELSFDPLGFVTMGPAVTGEFIIQNNDKNFGFGIVAGIRVTNLGIASNLLLGGGDMKLSYTVPVAFKYYPKTRNIADRFFVGPHFEYGTSYFKEGNKTRIRAFGLEFGYKWVFQNGFTLELVDLVGLIQERGLPYTYTTTTPTSTTTVHYLEGNWQNLAFVPYVVALRLGKTF
jgi:hypothetical protein